MSFSNLLGLNQPNPSKQLSRTSQLFSSESVSSKCDPSTTSQQQQRRNKPKDLPTQQQNDHNNLKQPIHHQTDNFIPKLPYHQQQQQYNLSNSSFQNQRPHHPPSSKNGYINSNGLTGGSSYNDRSVPILHSSSPPPHQLKSSLLTINQYNNKSSSQSFNIPPHTSSPSSFVSRPNYNFSSSNSAYYDNNQHIPTSHGFVSEHAYQQRTQTTETRSASFYEDRCKESLRESIRTAAESNEIAQNTASQLNCQAEQLQKIQSDTEQISHNLDTSEYLIKGMKSWWGSVVQLFTPPPLHVTNSLSRATSNNNNNNSSSSGPRGVLENGGGFGGHISNMGYNNQEEDINRLNGLSLRRGDLHSPGGQMADKKRPSSAFEHEIESDLDILSGMLTEMHSRAVEIGSSISSQNRSLDTIQSNVDSNSTRMTKQRKDIDALIGR